MTDFGMSFECGVPDAPARRVMGLRMTTIPVIASSRFSEDRDTRGPVLPPLHPAHRRCCERVELTKEHPCTLETNRGGNSQWMGVGMSSLFISRTESGQGVFP